MSADDQDNNNKNVETPLPLEQRLYVFVDENIREIRTGLYGVACLGLFFFLKGVRAFSQFKTVASIPDDFVKRGFKLRGVVKDVTKGGQLLVTHTPIINVKIGPYKATSDTLPITLAYLNLAPSGIQWLQETAINRKVVFQLLNKDDLESSLHCSVILKKRFGLNLNHHLVRQRLATVADDVTYFHSDNHSKLLMQLLAAEEKGNRRSLLSRLGAFLWPWKNASDEMKNKGVLTRIRRLFPPWKSK